MLSQVSSHGHMQRIALTHCKGHSQDFRLFHIPLDISTSLYLSYGDFPNVAALGGVKTRVLQFKFVNVMQTQEETNLKYKHHTSTKLTKTITCDLDTGPYQFYNLRQVDTITVAGLFNS